VVEFDQADLPWRYSPAAANANRLRPWMNLVVIAESEGKLAPPTSAVKQAILTTDAGALPDLSQSWAWAHTQFADQGLSPQAVGAQIRGRPGQFTSRIISPRVLAPSTSYLACLVPTFERGRLAGIGQAVPDDLDALTLSWTSPSSGSTQLPVYFFWRFQTGTVGSFRQLARLVHPVPLPADIGRRKMDVHAPGLNLRAASTATPPTLDVEGALQSLQAFQAGPSPWSQGDQSAWVAALKQFLNTPTVTVGGTPIKVVAPPLYGRWYAAETKLDTPRPPGSNPPWFYQLNSDPRARVGGGLGTVVIQNNQQALLASGWQQVGEIRAINMRLKIAQLGREIATRVFERHIVTGTADTFWTLTGRMHAFGTCGGLTMCQRFDASPVGRSE